MLVICFQLFYYQTLIQNSQFLVVDEYVGYWVGVLVEFLLSGLVGAWVGWFSDIIAIIITALLSNYLAFIHRQEIFWKSLNLGVFKVS